MDFVAVLQQRETCAGEWVYLYGLNAFRCPGDGAREKEQEGKKC